MKYKIIEIFDEDYGCEGISEDAELMCSVVLEDYCGTRKIIKISANSLVQKALSEGDVIYFPE